MNTKSELSEEDAKAERRLFQRLCNAMNIIVCLLMGSCQGLMIYYQIPYYSTFMFTIQFFRRGVIMAWLLVLIGCNFCTKGFFKENFPLFSRRRTRHISYGFVFAAIGIFTVQDPLTLALYQGYRENVCLAKDDCDSRFPPEVMLYIIAGMSTICLSSFPLGCINACIVWKFFNKFSDEDENKSQKTEDEEKLTQATPTSQPSSPILNSTRTMGNIEDNQGLLKTRKKGKNVKLKYQPNLTKMGKVKLAKERAVKEAKDQLARLAATIELARQKSVDELKRQKSPDILHWTVALEQYEKSLTNLLGYIVETEIRDMISQTNLKGHLPGAIDKCRKASEMHFLSEEDKRGYSDLVKALRELLSELE